MAMYRVVEKFTSINGEGMKAGQPAVFIRFAGCNLKCSFCDTMWANEPDAAFTAETAEEIYQYISETGITNVTLTGGEPLLQPDIENLLAVLLQDERIFIEIETNGSVKLDELMPLKMKFGERLLFTMDYKLPYSGMEDRMVPENFVLLNKEDTVKFVAADTVDLERAKEVIERHKLTGKCHVILSPVFGKMNPENMVDFLIKNKLNDVKMQLQMHKIIWDPEKKGV